MKLVPLCALLAVTAACAGVRGGLSSQLEVDTLVVGGAVFHVRYSRDDAGTARQVKGALERAVPAATRWGRLSVPVLITIHPTHQALEAATHREGHPWLRGWARFASVDLQSPRTWSSGTASDAQMTEILTHEVTHCVMYQSVASEASWSDLGIPLWFREGMASVTAGQEHGRARLAAIRRFYRERSAAAELQRTADPLSEAEPLDRFDSEFVYGTAHMAFRFLIERHGEERVRRLLASMGAGSGFGDAFRQAVGIPVEEFERDFGRYVVGAAAVAQVGRTNSPGR